MRFKKTRCSFCTSTAAAIMPLLVCLLCRHVWLKATGRAPLATASAAQQVHVCVCVWWCRQTAAGDQLRITYEQLSKDPNSLSNLDQDLPNYAQHSVPIHSLPMVGCACPPPPPRPPPKYTLLWHRKLFAILQSLEAVCGIFRDYFSHSGSMHEMPVARWSLPWIACHKSPAPSCITCMHNFEGCQCLPAVQEQLNIGNINVYSIRF